MISSKTSNKIIIVILILIIIVLWPYACSVKRQYDSAIKTITALDIKNQKFTKEKQKDSSIIASQQQVIITEKQAKEAGLLENKKLKNVKAQIDFKTITNTGPIEIPYTHLTPDDTITLPEFRKPFIYTEKNNWFVISGTATNQGISLDYYKDKHEYSLTIADKKLGFFKKAEPSVLLQDKNPYTDITQMSNIIIIYKQPIYKRNEFWAGTGFIIGALVGSKL